MKRTNKNLVLVGLMAAVLLGFVGPAWGQDSDGDGVPDGSDLCPGTDPCTAVDAVGCSMVLVYTHSQQGAPQGFNIATDYVGDVWQSTSSNDGNEVWLAKFDGDTLLESYSFGVTIPSDPAADLVYTSGLAVNGAGHLVFAGYDLFGTYTLVTISDACQIISQHDMSSELNAGGIGLDLDDNVWWAGFQPVAHDVVLVDNDNGSVIMEVDNTDLAGAGLSWYYSHYGAAVDENGLVYVCDHTRVLRFDPCDIANTAVVIAGNADHSPGTGPGEFGYWITGIAVVQERLFVGDPENDRIQIFKASTGEYIQDLVVTAADPASFVDDLAVDRVGNVFVNQTGAAPRIHKFAPPPATVPPCWDYLTQCHGDTDGDGDVDTVDWPIFRDSFGYAYPSVNYHPCGDMDHDGDVDTVDWPEFRDNFGYPTADCTPGGTWPPAP